MNYRDVLIILSNVGVFLIDDIVDGFKGSGLMYYKFLVVDGKIIIVILVNFIISGIYGDFLEFLS